MVVTLGNTLRRNEQCTGRPMEDLPNGYNVTLHRTLSPSRPYGSVQAGDYCEQHLDNLRRKDALRGAETTEISVRLGSYSASHFEGSATAIIGNATA
jgi:hypothetical protein